MSNIELKNIKHSAFASQETFCYEASVYFNGKRVGTARNDGHGGADYQYIEDKQGWDSMQKYIDSLLIEHDEVLDFKYKPDIEGICSDLVNKWLMLKDLKKLLKKKAVISISAGQLMEIGYKGTKKPDAALFSHARKQHPGGTLLNELPITDALALYKQGA